MITKHFAFTFLMVLFTQIHQPALAQKADTLILKYDVLSEGKNVGSTTVKLSRSGNTHTYAEYSRIKTSSWWGKIDIKSILIENSINKTRFVSADAKTLDRKTVYWTSLVTNNTGFTGTFAEIKNATVQEKMDIMDMAFAILEKQALNTKEITTLSRSMFANRKSPSHSAQFAPNSFDTTFNNLPFFLQEFVGRALPTTLKIMDSEDLVITKMKIKDLGPVKLSIGGKSIETRYFQLLGSKFKPMKIWIKSTPSSIPHVIRYAGENKDGPFEVRLRP